MMGHAIHHHEQSASQFSHTHMGGAMLTKHKQTMHSFFKLDVRCM
jgi:hypothetical protein